MCQHVFTYTITRFQHYNRIYFIVSMIKMVKQNPVIPNIHSGANIIIYTLQVRIVFIILFIVHIFEKHVEMQLVLPA